MSYKISCSIICKNEEKNITDCLKSVEWCDEIIVVDSLSTDRTVEIAKTFTSKVFVRPWEGYAAQRVFAFSQTTHDWNIYLDADERILTTLRNQIQAVLSQEQIEENGFWMRRLNFYFGGAIRHGGCYPDYQLRLFRKSKGQMTNVAVHEGIELTGKAGHLTGEILHYTATNWEAYKRKQDSYTTLAVLDASKNPKYHKRVTPFDAYIHAATGFLKKFLMKASILDGIAGMYYAYFHGRDRFTFYQKLRQFQKRKTDN
jgi:(heptosyl)LPS beta-1,4-glucosyltransferase